MKIALLTDGIFPYVIGGMQKHSYYLAKYLAKNGIHVDLYHTNQSKSDISALEVFSAEEKKYIRSFVVDFPSLSRLPGHYLRESYEYSARILDEFKKNPDVDFIYVKGFSGWNLIQEKKRGYKCAPVGVNFHGYEMFQPAASFRARLEQRLFLRNPVLYSIRNSDHVFSYGGKITEIISSLGIGKNKIIEIPAGIEESWVVDHPSPVQDKRKFIFVGRYERRKGVQELNKALSELIRSHDFEFHFISPIPDDKKIESEKVIYHGSVTDIEKMKPLLRSSDVLVCPSHSEGMPNVILEAMASGLAIIATDVGTVSSIVTNQNGWILTTPDPDSIEVAMKDAVGIAANKLMDMKSFSIKNVRDRLLWDTIVTQTITALHKLV